MSLRMAIELPQDSYEPGDPVGGHVTVDGGDGIRGLEVWLAYVEWTEDYRATARKEGAHSLASGPVSEGERVSFEIGLPTDAPPEAQSAHGGLAWVVQAKADVRGPDVLADRQISVAPGQSG